VEVYEEHLYSNALQLVLGEAVLGLGSASAPVPPRVLLSTVTGELHALGLLMAHAAFALEGCDCAMLGVSTPGAQIVEAALRLRCDVVALSFAASMSGARAQREIAVLRERLPAAVELWAGGSCSGLRRVKTPGVRVFADLGEIAGAVEAFRAARRPAA
jgi:methylmalonyl-CoA mutase cobalamin-binding subunit